MKYEGTVCTFLYYLYYKFTRIENKLNTFKKKRFLSCLITVLKTAFKLAKQHIIS